ncbi:MAG: DUF5677 domain-containing protein [Phycisphaerales bacterium]
MSVSLSDAIEAHQELRDRVAETIDGEWEIGPPEFGLALVRLFQYAFNSYKAIDLLLPDLYYEQSSSLCRTLWETALHISWISDAPRERSRRFVQYTCVEYRRLLSRIEADPQARRETLDAFDQQFERVLNDYRSRDKHGRLRLHGRATGVSVAELASSMGEPWSSEYQEFFPVWSMYTHGAPGAVLFPILPLEKASIEAFEALDTPRTILLAFWSMELLARCYRLIFPAFGLDDEEFLTELDKRIGFSRSLVSKRDRYA